MGEINVLKEVDETNEMNERRIHANFGLLVNEYHLTILHVVRSLYCSTGITCTAPKPVSYTHLTLPTIYSV